ncbi:MAG: hypothetical protein HYV27_15425 [Candidatus Hydrogenedentes bacterium]|nr:hypothetical protein [Candidatus Hydrogenedentota bacterium]
MTANHPCEKTRAGLQRYLLQTSPDRERQAIEAHLHTCAACQEAFDAERARLAMLDSLPRHEAPAGLAERTLARIQEQHESRTRPAWFALGTAAGVLLVLIFTVLPMLNRSREASIQWRTQDVMRQLGMVFMMYANEFQGERWPKLAKLDRAWAPDLASLYPNFIVDSEALIAREHPEREKLNLALREALQQPKPDFEAAEEIMGESFGYLGYAVTNEKDFNALRDAKANKSLSDTSGTLTDPGGVRDLYTLREGVERFFITDINNPAGSTDAHSTIPVLVEIASWKFKKSVESYRGANVLYLDGHVEFVPFGAFPVIPAVLDALSGITTDSEE